MSIAKLTQKVVLPFALIGLALGSSTHAFDSSPTVTPREPSHLTVLGDTAQFMHPRLAVLVPCDSPLGWQLNSAANNGQPRLEEAPSGPTITTAPETLPRLCPVPVTQQQLELGAMAMAAGLGDVDPARLAPILKRIGKALGSLSFE